jgi:hypothetical protein
LHTERGTILANKGKPRRDKGIPLSRATLIAVTGKIIKMVNTVNKIFKANG